MARDAAAGGDQGGGAAGQLRALSCSRMPCSRALLHRCIDASGPVEPLPVEDSTPGSVCRRALGALSLSLAPQFNYSDKSSPYSYASSLSHSMQVCRPGGTAGVH